MTNEQNQPQTWRDRHGDIWTEGADGLLHTPESRPFSRGHVERKWGPLTEVREGVDARPQLHTLYRFWVAASSIGEPVDQEFDGWWNGRHWHALYDMGVWDAEQEREARRRWRDYLASLPPHVSTEASWTDFMPGGWAYEKDTAPSVRPDTTTDHAFLPVAGHPDDDECTHRADGTDATYCGRTEAEHDDTAADEQP